MDPKRLSWVTTIVLILLLAGLAFHSRGCPATLTPAPALPRPVVKEAIPEPPTPPPPAPPPEKAPEPLPPPPPKTTPPAEEAIVVPPPDPDTLGAIEGTVRLLGQAPDREWIDLRPEPLCAARHPNGLLTEDLAIDKGGIAWAVVYIDGTSPRWDKFPFVPRPRVVSIAGCNFVPHVVDAYRGSPITFLNQDKIAHVLYMLGSDGRKSWTINLGGEQKSGIRLSPNHGFERLYCDIHPWESAWIASMRTPFYAITDKQGRYRIDNIPRGNYQVFAWQERCVKEMGVPKSQDVRVRAGETQQVDFGLRLAR